MSIASNNLSNSFREIKSGVGSAVTMDSFRAAVIDGNAYKVAFADTTGIVSGVTYYYYVKNTSTTKQVWLRPMTFSKAPIVIKIIRGGTFTLDAVAYDPDTYIDMDITGDFTLGSNVVTNIPSTTNLRANMTITGTGIPDRTYIYQVVNSTSIALTNVATATGTTVAMIASLPEMIYRNLNSAYDGINYPSMRVWYQNILGTVLYADSAIEQIYNTVDYEMKEPSNMQETFDIIGPGDDFMITMTNYGTLKMPYRIGVQWSEV